MQELLELVFIVKWPRGGDSSRGIVDGLSMRNTRHDHNEQHTEGSPEPTRYSKSTGQ